MDTLKMRLEYTNQPAPLRCAIGAISLPYILRCKLRVAFFSTANLHLVSRRALFANGFQCLRCSLSEPFRAISARPDDIAGRAERFPVGLGEGS